MQLTGGAYSLSKLTKLYGIAFTGPGVDISPTTDFTTARPIYLSYSIFHHPSELMQWVSQSDFSKRLRKFKVPRCRTFDRFYLKKSPPWVGIFFCTPQATPPKNYGAKRPSHWWDAKVQEASPNTCHRWHTLLPVPGQGHDWILNTGSFYLLCFWCILYFIERSCKPHPNQSRSGAGLTASCEQEHRTPERIKHPTTLPPDHK